MSNTIRIPEGSGGVTKLKNAELISSFYKAGFWGGVSGLTKTNLEITPKKDYKYVIIEIEGLTDWDGTATMSADNIDGFVSISRTDKYTNGSGIRHRAMCMFTNAKANTKYTIKTTYNAERYQGVGVSMIAMGVN